MKLVDAGVILGRINSLLLMIEEPEKKPEAAVLAVLAEVQHGLNELKHGLDFYLEIFPKTIAPGLKNKRKKTTRRRKKRK